MNIYSRLLKLYRTNSQRTPREDFTTEIFVGILEKEQCLLDDFVNNFLFIQGEKFEIVSQGIYSFKEKNDCRIDIIIENKYTRIFIENKIDSLEGVGQLEKYSKVLTDSEDKQGYLFYCTKNFEEKKLGFKNFKQFRWKDIFKFYHNQTNSKEIINFLEFLEEEKIIMNKKFDFTDLMVLEKMVDTISKMDEVLNEASKHLEKYFGKVIQGSSRSTQITRNHIYSTFSKDILKNAKYSDIAANFSFNKDEYSVPHLEVVLWVENSDYLNFRDHLEKNESNLAINGNENRYTICLYKPFHDFFDSENQIEDINTWFKESIQLFKNLKDQTLSFGWN